MGIPISNVTRRVVYAASGTGPYNFTFEILANTDVAVYKDDTLLTLTTDYTVTINANGTGYITLVASPTGATQIAIVGNRTIQRTTDFVTGGDFFANTVNDEMDQQTIFAQQNAEGLQRALQAPQTDPTSINMTLPRASVRANKTLAFDASGNPTTGEVIGDNRGNWAAGAAYNKRDIVKDTSNGNVYYANTAHTSSGSQPISTNADSAKWDLIVDNASAGASATDAAASASAAATSASNASTSASNASTSATNAANSATASANSATDAAASAAAAAASFDAFDDIYLGAKSSDPTVDNDGNALTTGDQYFNTVANELRVYNGSTWQAASTVGGTVTSLSVTGATTLAQNPTLSAGTANGVAYLNGSKVLTTGSALTFDGSNLSTTGNMTVNGTNGYNVQLSGGNAYRMYATTNDLVFRSVTAGSDVMTLTYGGNVGIGTSSPSTRLEVRNDTSNLARVRVTSSATTAGEYRGYEFGNGTSFKGGLLQDQSTDMISIFTPIAGQALRLTTEGNLGLGVTPSATSGGYKNVQNGNAVVMGSTSDVSAYWNSNATFNSGWKYISNGTSARYEQTALGGHAWYTAPSGTAGNAISFTQAMTLDASGNLLVGGTSQLQSAIFSAYGSVAARNGGVDGTFANAFVGVYSGNSNEHNAIQTAVSSAGTGSGFRFRASLGGGSSSTYPVLDLTRDQTIFYTANTERARIDSSGNLLVGTTGAGGQAGLSILPNNSNGAATLFWDRASTSSTSTALNFENGNATVGSVTYTNTGTAYNTSSDYRLKNTIAPMTGALAKVAALKPCTYKWNADGSDGEGFIAHELAEVVPQCVTGEKDAVDAEGNPVYQGIDTSFLVATLTAAIQELKAELDSVKSELASLKGN